MKSYKLNKTFENSIFPIEKQLAELNNSTHKSFSGMLANFFAAFFSGIGTSIAFYQNILPEFLCSLLKYVFGEKEVPDIIYAGLELVLLIVVFVLLYNLGRFLFRDKSKQKKIQKKKKTDEGRSRLQSDFHKSVVNNIVMGTSFVSKAILEETEGKGQTKRAKDNLTTVELMYLCEAVYYYSLAEQEIEFLNLFDTEMEEKSIQLINKIGVRTLLYTILVFKEGVMEVYNFLPKSDEQKQAKDILGNIEKYEHMLNRLTSEEHAKTMNGN